MGVETERKFLVKSDAWRATAGAGTVMAQGYLADTERALVRVRVAGNCGFLTVKGRNTGISRAEFEYDIPAGDALTILETRTCGGIVKKTKRLSITASSLAKAGTKKALLSLINTKMSCTTKLIIKGVVLCIVSSIKKLFALSIALSINKRKI